MTIAHEQGTVIEQRYEPDGIIMDIRVSAELAQQFEHLSIDEPPLS